MTDYEDLSEKARESSPKASAKTGAPRFRVKVEPELESQRLEQLASDMNKVQFRTEKQRLWQRRIAFWTAILVMIGFAALELKILSYAMYMHFEPGDLFFLWAVSPIAAITAIMIAVLIGVFRGYRGNEMDGVANLLSKIGGGDSP